MLPARRGLVCLRDAQRCQPYHVGVGRDVQEGFHLLLVEGEDPGGPQPLTRGRHGDVRKGHAQIDGIRVHVSADHRDRLVEPGTGDDHQGRVGMCFPFVQAPASFRFASSSETTMNFQGWRLSADSAKRAAFTTAWTFCSGTGSGLYLLTLFTDLMASRTSI